MKHITPKLNQRLLAHLKHRHTGAAKSVSSRALEVRLQVSGATLRRMVAQLRKDGHPICSGQSGYFYAESSNELGDTLALYTTRLISTAKVQRALESTLHKMPANGQITFEG